MALKKLFFSRKAKPFSTNTPTTTDDNNIVKSGCFDCNICLDLVRDPVVTLCGHLYCWPCIYEWFHVQRSSSLPPDSQRPLCPVCKTQLSPTSVVPLYGRGQLPHNNPAGPGQDQQEVYKETISAIPPRPPALTAGTLSSRGSRQIQLQRPRPLQDGEDRGYYPPRPREEEVGGNSYAYAYSSTYNQGRTGIGMGNNVGLSVVHPVLEMFVEMFYARAFGNSSSLYSYPNAYQAMNNARERRQEMQADKSLNRISVFLLCCFVLCLILF